MSRTVVAAKSDQTKHSRSKLPSKLGWLTIWLLRLATLCVGLNCYVLHEWQNAADDPAAASKVSKSQRG